jgi:branched-chain amino acid transport system permease protein
MTEFLQFLVLGILTGGVYALLAAGLGLIFGVLRVVNFAQADFMMLAMFLAYVLWAGPGIDPFVGIPLAFLAFLVVGMAFHRTLLGRVTGARENHEAQVILTLGVGLILQNAILIASDARPRVIVPGYARDALDVGPLQIGLTHLISFGVAVAVAVGLYLFLQRTVLGRAIRGTAEDWEAATYMGVDISRAQRIAFGLGIALTAVGGVALASFQPLDPFVGLDFIVIMFAAVVLGGLGSIGGAFAGGLIIGIVEAVSQVWTAASLSMVWVFAIFVLILFVRPQGLFGKAERAV